MNKKLELHFKWGTCKLFIDWLDKYKPNIYNDNISKKFTEPNFGFIIADNYAIEVIDQELFGLFLLEYSELIISIKSKYE